MVFLLMPYSKNISCSVLCKICMLIFYSRLTIYTSAVNFKLAWVTKPSNNRILRAEDNSKQKSERVRQHLIPSASVSVSVQNNPTARRDYSSPYAKNFNWNLWTSIVSSLHAILEIFDISFSSINFLLCIFYHHLLAVILLDYLLCCLICQKLFMMQDRDVILKIT